MAFQNGYVSDRNQFCKPCCSGKNCTPPALVRVSPFLTARAPASSSPSFCSHVNPHTDWKASDGEDVNCWICLGVPQTGEDAQVQIIGTLCRKIIHQDFINQLKQGDADQVLALLNQTLTLIRKRLWSHPYV
jgi:fructose-specific PTS system IIA-like component